MGSGVHLGPGAKPIYHDRQTATDPNIDCIEGTVAFYFKSDWASKSAGGLLRRHLHHPGSWPKSRATYAQVARVFAGNPVAFDVQDDRCAQFGLAALAMMGMEVHDPGRGAITAWEMREGIRGVIGRAYTGQARLEGRHEPGAVPSPELEYLEQALPLIEGSLLRNFAELSRRLKPSNAGQVIPVVSVDGAQPLGMLITSPDGAEGMFVSPAAGAHPAAVQARRKVEERFTSTPSPAFDRAFLATEVHSLMPPGPFAGWPMSLPVPKDVSFLPHVERVLREVVRRGRELENRGRHGRRGDDRRAGICHAERGLAFDAARTLRSGRGGPPAEQRYRSPPPGPDQPPRTTSSCEGTGQAGPHSADPPRQAGAGEAPNRARTYPTASSSDVPG